MLQPSTLQFLRELKENNHKPWFDENRRRYEAVKKDYQQLVAALLAEMQRHDPTLAMLSVKDCTFRINRDIRFSADKSPYKTNLGISLSPYGKKLQMAGYYVHIEPGTAFVGGGLYMPEAPQLKKVRKEIDYFYSDLRAVVEAPAFVRTYGDLDRDPGAVLSRPPKGYEAHNPAIEYLKLKSFTAVTTLDDALLTQPALVQALTASLLDLQPFIAFINRGLMAEDNE